MLIRSLASICLYLELCLAAKVSVLVQSSPILNNPSNLPPSTHAILLGPPGTRYDVPLRRDNTFVFPDLTEASYLLTIHTLHYNFQPLRVDVSNTGSSQKIEAWQTFRGNEWSNKGPSVGSSSGGNDLQIQVRPSGQREYYSQRGGFNLVAFLKSPMILMGLVSVVMIFGFPYLMDNSTLRTNFSPHGRRG